MNESFAALTEADRAWARERIVGVPLARALDHLLEACVASLPARRAALMNLAVSLVARHPEPRALFADVVAGSLDTNALTVADARLAMSFLAVAAERLQLAGDDESALSTLEEAARIAEDRGSSWDTAVVFQRLADMYARAGRDDAADSAWRLAARAAAVVAPEVAIRINRRRAGCYADRLRAGELPADPPDLDTDLRGEPVARRLILGGLAEQARQAGDAERARDFLAQARGLKPTCNEASGLLLTEARLAADANDFEVARLMLREAADLAESEPAKARVDRERVAVDQLLGLPVGPVALGHFDRATAKYREALDRLYDDDEAGAEMLLYEALEMAERDRTRADAHGMLGRLVADRDAARRHLHEGVRLYDALGLAVDHAIALVDLAALDDNPEALLTQAQAIAVRAGAESVLADIAVQRADLAAAAGNSAEALLQLETAIGRIEHSYLGLSAPDAAASYFRRCHRVFDLAVTTALAASRPDIAVEFVERFKARRLGRDIDDAATDAPAGRDLRRRLLHSKALSVKEQQALRAAPLPAEPVSSAALAAAASQSGAALASFYVRSSETVIHILEPGGGLPLAVRADVGWDELERAAGELRGAFACTNPRRLYRSPSLAWLNELGERLLGSLERTLAPDTAIVVAAHGPLHRLPLHLIPCGDAPPIGLRRPVTHTPSLPLYAHLQRRRTHAARTAAVFATAATEDSEREHELFARAPRAFAERFGTEARVGLDASVEAFRTVVADHIYVSCHGWFDKTDPANSCLLLSDGQSLPSRLDVSDPWHRLTVRELLAVPLRSRLVVLDACLTGSQRIGLGEEPLGLPAAFLLAGAEAILATNWTVEANASAHFMISLLDGWRGDATLGEAMRDAYAATYEEYPHPYLWAGFSLHGNLGMTNPYERSSE